MTLFNWKACCAAALAGFAIGLVLGSGHAAKLCKADKAVAAAKQSAVVAQHVEKQSVVTQESGLAAAKAQQEIRYVYRTIEKEIPTYVTVSADSRCIVPVGFVRVHDAAASGSSPVSPAAGEPNDAPSGVGISDVAGTVVHNYGTCQATARQLTDLQNWVRRQQSTWAP